MFRARVMVFGGHDGQNPDTPVFEVWLPVHNPLPLEGGSLSGTVNGEKKIIREGEWYFDRDL